MTKDQFNTEKMLIRDSGLRALEKQSKLRALMKQYWNQKIYDETSGLRNRAQKNVEFLSEVFKRKPVLSAIKEGMNCDIPDDLYTWIVDDGKLSTLRSFIILSTFYGIPLETFLFEDLTIFDKDEFIKRYNTISRQDKV